METYLLDTAGKEKELKRNKYKKSIWIKEKDVKKSK